MYHSTNESLLLVHCRSRSPVASFCCRLLHCVSFSCTAFVQRQCCKQLGRPTLRPYFNFKMSAPYPYAPPPAQEGPSSPRRRQHAVQPPNLLTTSLGNARNIGLGLGGSIQTPLSTTSLSSPFSTYQPSPYPASPGGAMRGVSPMATRTPAAYNTPYNPQQWGSSSSSSSSALGTRPRQLTRVEQLAPRPVGPDGMLEGSLT